MKKFTTILCFMFIITIAFGTMSVSAQSNQIELRMATVYADTHPNSIAARRAAELIERRTNGEVILNYFPAGQLGDNNEITEGMMTGSIDMSIGGAHNVAEHYAEIGITVGPYVFRDFEHAYKVMESELGEYFNERLQEETGIRFLDTWKYGLRHLTTQGLPVETPDDLAGAQIRAPDDEIGMATVRAMGASPTPMAFSELYMGLQQGTVDGQENPISTIVTSNFHEVQDHLILTGHTTNTVFILMSEIAWNKLNEEQQEIVKNAFRETRELNDYMIDQISESGIQIFEDAGGTVIEPDIEAFREAAESVYTDTFGDRWGIDLYNQIQDIE